MVRSPKMFACVGLLLIKCHKIYKSLETKPLGFHFLHEHFYKLIYKGWTLRVSDYVEVFHLVKSEVFTLVLFCTIFYLLLVLKDTTYKQQQETTPDEDFDLARRSHACCQQVKTCHLFLIAAPCLLLYPELGAFSTV